MQKILITGKFSPFGSRPIGGLQSWILTVHNELVRLGHDVTVWEPHDCKYYPEGTTFDLGIFANIDLTRNAIVTCKKSILISHGIIDAEKPDNSCDALMFVSEGVRDHWKMDGEIIRQPIDLEFWKPERLEKNKLTRYSYRYGNIHGEKVADMLDMDYLHAKDLTHRQARDVINSSHLVFATGRAALEAMACDVPTVIYDHRDAYQPALMGEWLHKEMKQSYSGRSGYTPSLSKVLAKAKKELNHYGWRKWVAENHDVRKIVKQLC
jgi:hypothetical protein